MILGAEGNHVLRGLLRTVGGAGILRLFLRRAGTTHLDLPVPAPQGPRPEGPCGAGTPAPAAFDCDLPLEARQTPPTPAAKRRHSLAPDVSPG
jgi:hypothetical protein